MLIIIGFSVLAISAKRGPIGGLLKVPGITLTDHIKGSLNAKANLIAYEDFQCPACANYAPLLDRLSVEFGESLAIVFRNFPLRTIHKNANVAAYAAEAAAKQGKFWQMHDILYAKQVDWENVEDPKAMFVIYAGQIGIDMDRFIADLNSQEIKDKIDVEYATAMKIGIAGTPTLFINGIQIKENPSSYEGLKAIIQENLSNGQK